MTRTLRETGLPAVHTRGNMTPAPACYDTPLPAGATKSKKRCEIELRGSAIEEWVIDDPFPACAQLTEMRPSPGNGVLQVDWETHERYGFMLRSPPFAWDDEEGFTKARRAWEILKEKYPNVHLHSGDALFVNAGQGHRFRETMDLETRKKFFAALWSFEDTISFVHPLYRVDRETLGYSDRIGIAESSGRSDLSKRRLGEGIRALLDAKTSQDLEVAFVFHDCDAPTYGPFDVREPRYGGYLQVKKERELYPKIFKFRQHEATMNFERVESWVKVCMGILAFAERTDMKTLRKEHLKRA